MSTAPATLYLMIPDTARRAACFRALVASLPQRVVRGFADVKTFLAEQNTLPDGCVIIDLGEGRLTELRALLMAIAANDALCAVVAADALGVDDALALIRAGVRDIVSTPVAPMILAERAEALLPQIAADQSQRAAFARAEAQLARLSGRERMILSAIAEGQSNKEIARALALSPRTVEVHRANIMRRAEAASLAELLKMHFVCEAFRPPSRIAA